MYHAGSSSAFSRVAYAEGLGSALRAKYRGRSTGRRFVLAHSPPGALGYQAQIGRSSPPRAPTTNSQENRLTITRSLTFGDDGHSAAVSNRISTMMIWPAVPRLNGCRRIGPPWSAARRRPGRLFMASMAQHQEPGAPSAAREWLLETTTSCTI